MVDGIGRSKSACSKVFEHAHRKLRTNAEILCPRTNTGGVHTVIVTSVVALARN